LELIIMILTPLEMLLVNLFAIHKCSRRRYGRLPTYACMGAFAFVLLYVSFLFARIAPGFGGGSGLFVFGGFLFFIPIKLLYDMPGIKIITISCFSWGYTFLLFALSVKMGYAMPIAGQNISETVLLFQTALYILTLKAFYGMLKNKFLYILENIGKKELVAFMLMCIMWFWFVFILNLSFLYTELHQFQILAFFTLAIFILSSFWYIFLHVSGDQAIQILEKIAYQDELTQLGSRVVLGMDADELIMGGAPFHLIFFDLDDFKSVNDQYSHQVGDRYLAFFAHEIMARIADRGGLYRIAGDEFVCLFVGEDVESFIGQLSSLPEKMPDSFVRFLGFSYGLASFPDDGETADKLLNCADRRMYAMKHRSKRSKRLIPLNTD
jgi:diguanylate cyclase (GGDEF)-like protein